VKPVTQTKLHDPENGVIGNCYTACLASILELDMNVLASFEQYYGSWAMSWEKDREDAALLVASVRELARVGGVVMVRLGIQNPMMVGIVPHGFSIATGPGPRGFPHATVAHCGDIVHDPHPSRDGLLKIQDYEVALPIGMKL